MKPSLANHPGWQWCTAEGAELHTLLLGLNTPFVEKVRWLEEAELLSLTMRLGNRSLHFTEPSEKASGSDAPRV
ncbi:MAG TPA: hypothetical protein VIM57_06750 [Luteolibacter sp.]